MDCNHNSDDADGGGSLHRNVSSEDERSSNTDALLPPRSDKHSNASSSHHQRRNTFTPYFRYEYGTHEDGTEQGKFKNIKNPEIPNLIGSLKMIKNSAFSLALVDYCAKNSVEHSNSHPSSDNSLSNGSQSSNNCPSRYSRILQVLKNRINTAEVSKEIHSDDLPDGGSNNSKTEDLSREEILAPENEELYDFVSDVLMQDNDEDGSDGLILPTNNSNVKLSFANDSSNSQVVPRDSFKNFENNDHTEEILCNGTMSCDENAFELKHDDVEESVFNSANGEKYFDQRYGIFEEKVSSSSVIRSESNSDLIPINHDEAEICNGSFNYINSDVLDECIQKNTKLTYHHQGNLDSWQKIRSKFSIFHMRIKVSNYSDMLYLHTDYPHGHTDLEKCLDKIRASSCYSDLTENISMLTDILSRNEKLANAFLPHFINFIQSSIDLDSTLVDLNEFLMCLLPCLETIIKGNLETRVRNEIRQSGVLSVLYNSLKQLTAKETRLTQADIENISNYGMGGTIKAHIVRMQPEESQRIFQETFADAGNHTDLYLIYAWHILKLYSVNEKNSGGPLVTCLSEALENSGEYISIFPVDELSKKESRIRTLSLREKNPSKDCIPDVICDLTYELADFRIGQLYENGVVFLTNMEDWLLQLNQISLAVDQLEVKKYVKFIPALGSTYALYLEDGLTLLNRVEDVKYIRVRVVRVTGPVAQVYGLDSGTVSAIEVSQLIHLPGSLLNIPPCGRLALLPVVSRPRGETLAPTLQLLEAFSHHGNLGQDLNSFDIKYMIIWLQVPVLVRSTLNFFKAILKTGVDIPVITTICTLVIDFLFRLSCTEGSIPHIHQVLTILIAAMETSDRVRLFLAREGAFVTLADLGLRIGGPQVWNILRILIGGKASTESWYSDSIKLSHHLERSLKYLRIKPVCKENSGDQSPSVILVAGITTQDQNWDLEVRKTLSSRQLVPYSYARRWYWEKQEILAPVTDNLHCGHKLNVQNDETHHIIVDTSVPNIRMNTLLQIILGMLNTGIGGKIYIGLNQSGVVQGVRMTRDQRDCFMLGFSKLVTSEIFPMVLPCDSLIQYIPVKRSGLLPKSYLSPSISTSLTMDTASFVMILTVRPQPGLLYRCRNDPEPAYMREGGATSNLKGQRLTSLNKSVMGNVNNLQREVSAEKRALLELILRNETVS